MAQSPTIVLASGSQTRQQMLLAAGVDTLVSPVRVDEAALRDSMAAQGMSARDIAAELADIKAQRAAGRHPEGWIIAADQVLDLDGVALGKPTDLDAARAQLSALAGRRHALHSAVVVYHEGRHVWRHVETARLTMRPLSASEIEDYLAHIGTEALETAGSYRVEGYGIRLFERIEGDHFTILGLPLLPLLSYLRQREVL